jgi:amino acid adenylation domain-containing protein
MSIPAETLHEFLLAAAKHDPAAPAIIDVSADGERFETVSYGALSRRAHEYAAVLDELGLDVGDRVVIEADTSSSSITVLLACSMRGLAFIPVSPQTPAKRLSAILSSAEAALHLQTADGFRDGIDAPTGLGRFGVDGLSIERAPAPRTRHKRQVVSTDTAYMIFTSGTTGVPKGVVMSHRGVLGFYRGMLNAGIVGETDRVATTSPLQFDFALLDIGLALGSGACLVPVPRGMMSLPRVFLRLLREAEVTQVNGVPSIWRGVLRHEADALSELDRVAGVLFSGEAFPLSELRKLRDLLPKARIVNCFGPTEAMAFSLTDVPSPLTEEVRKLPIGSAYQGAEIMLIDHERRAIDEPGVVGEIHLRGPSLFTGYWNDPEGTSRALVPDPLNPRSGQLVLRSGDLAYRDESGELYFSGRVDSQVKVRGNRVELVEVERRLLEYHGVEAAVALVLPGDDPMLIAFVLAVPGTEEIDVRALSAFCREELPGYMVPRVVRVLDEFPVTANGKTDRARLTALAARPS